MNWATPAFILFSHMTINKFPYFLNSDCNQFHQWKHNNFPVFIIFMLILLRWIRYINADNMRNFMKLENLPTRKRKQRKTPTSDMFKNQLKTTWSNTEKVKWKFPASFKKRFEFSCSKRASVFFFTWEMLYQVEQ